MKLRCSKIMKLRFSQIMKLRCNEIMKLHCSIIIQQLRLEIIIKYDKGYYHNIIEGFNQITINSFSHILIQKMRN